MSNEPKFKVGDVVRVVSNTKGCWHLDKLNSTCIVLDVINWGHLEHEYQTSFGVGSILESRLELVIPANDAVNKITYEEAFVLLEKLKTQAVKFESYENSVVFSNGNFKITIERKQS